MKFRYVFGLILILFGASVLLNTLGLAAIHPWQIVTSYFWPIVFMVVGLAFFLNLRVWSFSRVLMGLALFAIGALMAANHAGWLHVASVQVWSLFWPVVLILFGIQLLFNSRQDGRSWAVLSSISRQHPGWTLRSNDYWTLLGGVTLDLRTANIEQGRATLQITTVLGGVDIIVPDTMHVVVDGVSILGGLKLFGREYGGIYTNHTDEHGPSGENIPEVRVHCTSILGGLKIQAR